MSRSIWTRSRGLLPLTIFFALIGLYGISLSLWLRSKGLNSKHWATATGIVLSSEIQTERTRSSTTYFADLKYSYAVHGVRYVASAVHADDYGSGDRDHAASIIAKYPVGDSVIVYYKTSDPDVAVLETGLSGGWMIGLLVGIVFLLPGMFLTWAFFAKGKDFAVGIISMFD